MGMLIAIEGVDGSGKATQSKELYKRLTEAGMEVAAISFPDYDSPSSELTKMYLMGAFGQDAQAVDAYQASTFFAADRFASWRTKPWGRHYRKGGLVIADRYTTANMVHQAGKIADPADRQRYLDWLTDFEFRLYGIPQPDLVFFLDVPLENRAQLVKDRANKITGGSSQDIHEKDPDHLKASYQVAHEIARRYGWQTILCADGDGLRSVSDIADEIYGLVRERLKDLSIG